MATGNVKISYLGSVENEELRGTAMIPFSDTFNGDLESRKVTLEQISTYIMGGGGGGAETIAFASYLERDLGQYKLNDQNFCDNHRVELTEDEDKIGYYIDKDGKLQEDDIEDPDKKWSVSSEMDVKEGTLYFLYLGQDEDIPEGRVLFAKEHVHKYYDIAGFETGYAYVKHSDLNPDDPGYDPEDTSYEVVTYSIPIYEERIDIIYEPRSFHYENRSTSRGYGVPKSGYVVFLATEDETLVVSAPHEVFDIDSYLYATHYGMFSEITEKYLAVNSDLATAISESVAELDGRVSSLEKSRDTLGDADIYSANFTEMPQYRGGALVVQSDHAPLSTMYITTKWGEYVDYDMTGKTEEEISAYIAENHYHMHAPDYVNHAGQIWTYDNNAWMGLTPGEAAWKQISLS